MTTRELYELASMDALGLLDDDERQAFENAFRAAPAHVQAEIRREQLREAQSTEYLPDVKPPASLRARVIAAVLGKAELLNTEPIASIGPAARSAASTTAFWRAACIGFATATVVLAGFVYTVAEQNKIIAQEALDAEVIADLRDSDGRLDQYLYASETKFVSFHPAAALNADGANTKAKARLFYKDSTKSMLLVCSDLPIAPTEYSFVLHKKSGDPVVAPFKVTKDTTGIEIHSVDFSQLTRFEIRAPSRNGTAEVILEGGDV